MGNEHSKDKEQPNRNGRIPEKHINGSANGLSANLSSNGLEISANGETAVQKNSEPFSSKLATEPNDFVIVELDRKPAAAPVISEILEVVIHKEEVKESEEDQTDATNPLTETAKRKQESESLTEPESVTPASDEGNQEDNNPEENPVMNFFKSLTTSKITKKETAAPAAVKDQVAQVSEPPAAPKGMSIPPPPPPEPPKMDFKAEPAAKPVKPTPKEEPKAVAKQPESSKGKSAKDTLSKLFRSKRNKESPTKADIEVDVQQVVDVEETPVEAPEPVVVEVKVNQKRVVNLGLKGRLCDYITSPCSTLQRNSMKLTCSCSSAFAQSENNVDTHDSAEQVAQPVLQAQMVAAVSQPMVAAEKVDSSKAGTLEAAAKPEPPPPVQETKKTASTSSFFSLFKPKAADPKKASPAPAAAAETVKAKEEPKAAAKSSEAVVDNKPASVASQAGGAAANEPKKLEKRNSIHQFFKILGQKRNSTDAGIQTETIAVPPAPEKVK
ncbi:breast carcinoma-amplified sequence 1 isoform X2 [Pungitius pungitius]|uniref:breast carcinoma-amplified sequence 1 isoform X2 n=1 Tax=Pungitius pungitius TaxID=134920 RepID=UPI002E10A7DE